MADSRRGRRLTRANDIVCRPDGSIYFTDMGRDQHPALRVWEEEEFGVFRLAPDGRVQPVPVVTISFAAF